MTDVVKDTYLNGNIMYEIHYLNGLKHREDGPAIVRYFENGSIMYCNYYIDDILLTETEFLIHQRKRKLKSLSK